MTVPDLTFRLPLVSVMTLSIAAAVLGAMSVVAVGSASAEVIPTTPCHLHVTYTESKDVCKSSNQTLYLEMTSGFAEPECETETLIEWYDGATQRLFLFGGTTYTITHSYSRISGAFPIWVVNLPVSGPCIFGDGTGGEVFFALAHTPTMTTGSASSESSTSERLDGLLDANYSEMRSCRFEYGLTPAYGSTVPCEGFGPGIWEVSEPTALVEHLTPGTEYHYRLSGSNDVGAAFGADGQFVTSLGLPVAVTGPATEVEDTSALVHGSVNPEGSELTGCVFEYGPTTAYGSSVSCSAAVGEIGAGQAPVPVAVSLTELAPDSEYHYRLVATNPNGTGTGSDGTFTTAGNVELQKLTLSQYDLRTRAMVPIPAGGRTVDGNEVVVSAELVNESDVDQKVDVFLGDSYPVGPEPLSFEEEDVEVAAHGSRTVTFTLDTEGMGWLGRKAAGEQQLTVELSDEEEEVRGLLVVPKPVIFVHGWQLDDTSSDAYAVWGSYMGAGGFLQRRNQYWEGFAVGDGKDGSPRAVMDTAAMKVGGATIAQNATQLATYVGRVRENLDAHHVDIVAHSMGGLISREYVQNQPAPPPGDSRPVVDHLVMLGTPNKGSDCADDLIAVAATAAAHPDAVVALASEVDPLLGAFVDYKLPLWTTVASNNPTRELTPEFVEGTFDRRVTQGRGTQFLAVAGTWWDHDYCSSGFPEEPNDGVVNEKSAWGVAATDGASPLRHTQFQASEDVFGRWVFPTLAVEATQARGSGFRRGGVTANALRTTGRPQIKGLSRAAGDAWERSRRGAQRPADVCLRPTDAAPVSAAYSLRLRAGGTGALRLPVPPGAGGLHVSVLGGAGLGLSLRDPSGRVVDEHKSEETEGELVWLGAEAPQAGEWRLVGTSKGTSGPTSVLIGVQLDHPVAKLSASLATSGGRHHHRRAGGSEIRIHLRGVRKGTARITVTILPEGKASRTLSARRVPGQKGRFTVDERLARSIPALVSIVAAGPTGYISALFELREAC